jgi:hypothetical protein
MNEHSRDKKHLVPVRRGLLHKLKRCSKVITFSGASVVLLTFIVKDGWRESVKNLADTVESAQNIYTLRADGLATASQLGGLTSEVEAIRGKIEDNQLGMTLSGINRGMLLYSGQLRQLETSTDNLSHLNEKLATGEYLRQKIGDVRVQIRTQQEAFREIGLMTVQVARRADQHGSLSDDDAKAISRRIFDFNWQLVTLDRQVATLTSDTLTNAENEYSNREKSYRKATWISYCLYGIGWIVGLIGRLTGSEDMETDS